MSTTSKMQQLISSTAIVSLIVVSFATGTLAGAVQHEQSSVQHMLDSPVLRIISDEDRTLMNQVQNQIDNQFDGFKDVEEVHKFLDKVKLLVQKHPKNTALAQGDLKDLHKFLSSELITKLIRVDTSPFEAPISDEKMPFAQRAVEEDELTRKLFGGPLRSLAEAKKKLSSRSEDGNHHESNFFVNIWCKISGNCSN